MVVRSRWSKSGKSQNGCGSKYHNQKTFIDGIRFDSAKEARRYSELKLMQKAGEIDGLQLQTPFELIPKQVDDSGKVIERAVTYKADFTYWQNGRLIVEDVKGIKTDAYKVKKKLMLWRHGIRIQEV